MDDRGRAPPQTRRSVIKVSNDFNLMEDDRAVVLNDSTPAEALVPGIRIILYEPGQFECEAIVRRGKTWPWVADTLEGTFRDYPQDDCSEAERSRLSRRAGRE